MSHLIGKCLGLARSPTGALRVALLGQERVEVWEVVGSWRTRVLEVGPEGSAVPYFAVFSADGRFLAVGYYDTELLKLPSEER
ncbi:MAG: hypothetical protein ABDI20_06875, partial [Candidatus Bipolaricaulaceae bacterium]